jgi:hypothetical protein
MINITQLSESQLQNRVDAKIDVVSSTTTINNETVDRPVDSDDTI